MRPLFVLLALGAGLALVSADGHAADEAVIDAEWEVNRGYAEEFYAMCTAGDIGLYNNSFDVKKNGFKYISDLKLVKTQRQDMYDSLPAADKDPITQHIAFYCGVCDFLSGSDTNRDPETKQIDLEKYGPPPTFYDFKGQVLYIIFIFLFSGVLPVTLKKFGPDRNMSANKFLTNQDDLEEMSGDGDENVLEKVDVGALPNMYGDSMEDAQDSEDDMQDMMDGWLTDGCPAPLRVLFSKMIPTIANGCNSIAFITAVIAYYEHYNNSVTTRDVAMTGYCWFQFVVALPFFPPIIMPIIKLMIKAVKGFEKMMLSTKKIVVQVRLSKNPLEGDTVGTADDDDIESEGKLAQMLSVGESVGDAAEAARDGAEVAVAVQETFTSFKEALGSNPMENISNLKDMNFSDKLAEPLDEIFTPLQNYITFISFGLGLGTYMFLAFLFFLPALIIFFPVVVVAALNVTIWTSLMVFLGNCGYIASLTVFHFAYTLKNKVTGGRKMKPLQARLRDEYEWVVRLASKRKSQPWFKWLQSLPYTSLTSFGFTVGFFLLMLVSSTVLFIIYLSYIYAEGVDSETWLNTADAVLGGTWFKKDHTWADGIYIELFGTDFPGFSIMFPDDFSIGSIGFVFSAPEFRMYDLSIFLGYFAFVLDFGVEFIFEPLVDTLFNADRLDAKILMDMKGVIKGMEERVKKDLGDVRVKAMKAAFSKFAKAMKAQADKQLEGGDDDEDDDDDDEDEELDELRASKEAGEKKPKKKSSGAGGNVHDCVITMCLEGVEYKKFNNKNSEALDGLKDAVIDWLGLDPAGHKNGSYHLQCSVRQYSDAEYFTNTRTDQISSVMAKNFKHAPSAGVLTDENKLAAGIRQQPAIK
jgi:hypothetical protein